jgi:hypothetical protein
MTIDRGHPATYNPHYPVVGINQSTRPFRDNFAIIKNAIENLHTAKSMAGPLSLSTHVDVDGQVLYAIEYTDGVLLVPDGNPKMPRAGMLRYRNGGIELYNGADWLEMGRAAQDEQAGRSLPPVTTGPGIRATIGDGLHLEINLDDAAHGKRGGGDMHMTAIANGRAGFMSGEDKARLDRLSQGSSLQNIFASFRIEGSRGAITLTPDAPRTQLGLVSGAGIDLTVGTALDAVVIAAKSSDVSHGPRGGGLLHALVNAQNAGFMSSEDKIALDRLCSGTTGIWMEADAEYPTGRIMSFGGDAEVTQCSTFADEKVAGIVILTKATHVYIARTGRISCRVTGPVMPGDRIVSSEVPGLACAGNDAAGFAVIGRAITKNIDGEGEIELIL